MVGLVTFAAGILDAAFFLMPAFAPIAALVTGAMMGKARRGCYENMRVKVMFEGDEKGVRKKLKLDVKNSRLAAANRSRGAQR